MGDSQTYVKRDLIDYVDVDSEDLHGLYNRETALELALPEEANLGYTEVGSYDGNYAVVVELDGFLWVDTGYYGSCAVCDAFIAHPEEELENILRDAYCFESYEDLATWALETEATEMTVGRSREALRQSLSELDLPHDDI